MDDRRLEIKVGAFALVALVVAVGLVALLTGLHSGRTSPLEVDFAYAGGLPAGASVKIAGVKVGRVTEVSFRPDAKDDRGRPLPVRLTLEIERDAMSALRSDATATVGTQGALGESYLEVLPGTSPAPLEAGRALRGLDPPRLDVLFAKLTDVFQSAASDENFRNFLIEVSHLAHTLDEFLSAHQGELSGVVANLASTLADSRAALSDVRTAASGAARILDSAELKQTVEDLATTAKTARAELPKVLADTDRLVTSLNATAGQLTPDDVAKLKATVAKYDQLATTLEHVSKSAGDILAGIEKGEGTAGMVVKDPKVYQELKALLTDLRAHPNKLLFGN